MLLRKPCHIAPTALVKKHFDARQQTPTATVEQQIVTLREPASDNKTRPLAAARPSKSRVNHDRLHFKDLKQKRAMTIRNAVDAQHDGMRSCASAKRLGLYDVRNYHCCGLNPAPEICSVCKARNKNKVTCSTPRIAACVPEAVDRVFNLVLRPRSACRGIVFFFRNETYAPNTVFFFAALVACSARKISGTGLRSFLQEVYSDASVFSCPS